MTDPTPRLLADLGARVRRTRTERGWTVREAAERSDLSLRFYGDLEAGRANIAIGRLAGVARALGVPLTSLLSEETAPKNGGRAAIALLGLRGAGKSTLGKLLARELGLRFVELDDAIAEAAGMSVAEVFALHGEAYYRRLALQALREILGAGRPVVVALPGGIVHDDEAFSLVRSRCTTAWLRARPQDHMDRVVRQGDRRPMADRPDAMAELRAILAAREPLYAQADVTLDTSRRSREAALRALVAGLKREGWDPR
jgi:XRE family aerobic/anaerobic benzoate catabolism transcriptional regulator